MRRLFGALGALVMALASLTLLPAPASAAGLDAVVIPASGTPGTNSRVTGQNWHPHARLQIQTCGALGRGGSSVCDISKTYTTIASDKGRFATTIQLGKPPAPCPCVVSVTDADSADAVYLPVAITGQDTAKPPPPTGVSSAPPALQVVTASVSGAGPVSSWFGGAPKRTVKVLMRNTTAKTQQGSELQLFLGGAGAQDAVATVALPSIGPGETRTVEVPVTLNAGIGGTQTITGQINGGADFQVKTASWAWGFFVLDLVLLVVVITLILRRIRRRPSRPTGRRHAGTNGPEPAEQTV